MTTTSNESAKKKVSAADGHALRVFSQLARDHEEFRVIKTATEAEHTSGLEIVGFLKPDQILVSKWFPGYRTADITGKFADEAIGLLLADSLTTVDRLTAFQSVLATPDVAIDVITTLLPRAGVPVKNRKYQLSERLISRVVREKLEARGFTDVPSRVAFSHAITRVLSHMGVVAPDLERRTVALARSYAVQARDVQRIVLTEALRDLFSEARLQSISRDLDTEATPQVIGEIVGRLFRQLSFVIPEVKLRLEHLEIASSYIRLYHIDRTRVPNALQAHPALISLASIANFVVFSLGRVSQVEDLVAADLATVKEACNSILTIVQSAPSIEALPLASFAEHVGEVPAASPEGIRRGLVLYTAPGQTSRMEVVDMVQRDDGFEIASVPAEYVRVSAVAGAISGSLLSPEAKTGLANLVADELALASSATDGGCQMRPILLTLGVSDDDLVYLAMHKAHSVAYVREGRSGQAQLLYGCAVEEQWRTTVLAASPGIAFFSDPASVIVYTSKMKQVEPRPLPSRNQTLGTLAGRDMMYVGDIERFVVTNVEKPFSLKLPVTTYGGKTHVLDLKIMVLAHLLGYDETSYPQRGGAFYAAVREPGVNDELQQVLRVARAYAEDGGSILSDKAKSWLVEHLAPAMLHPAIRAVAERAINTAIIEQRLDARALAPQFKEVMVKAFAGTLLAVMNRFDQVDGATVVGLTNVLPTSGLTIKSQLLLASIPTTMNANYSKE